MSPQEIETLQDVLVRYPGQLHWQDGDTCRCVERITWWTGEPSKVAVLGKLANGDYVALYNSDMAEFVLVTPIHERERLTPSKEYPR